MHSENSKRGGEGQTLPSGAGNYGMPLRGGTEVACFLTATYGYARLKAFDRSPKVSLAFPFGEGGPNADGTKQKSNLYSSPQTVDEVP